MQTILREEYGVSEERFWIVNDAARQFSQKNKGNEHKSSVLCSLLAAEMVHNLCTLREALENVS